MADVALGEELIHPAREQGVELLGENGLLWQMIKAALERGFAKEPAENLGNEPRERSRAVNAPSGTTKRLRSEASTIDLDEPQLVRCGEPRLDGVDKIVIGSCARHDRTRGFGANGRMPETHQPVVLGSDEEEVVGAPARNRGRPCWTS